MKNILFLDFDGVINVSWWNTDKRGKFRAYYNFPEDGCVNHTQAVQWVSEFCEKFNYDIVVSSTWRKDLTIKELGECLKKSGLREGINVIDITPILDDKDRGDEITMWLKAHPEVKNYIIFDDDSDMTCHTNRLIQTRNDVGFMLDDFYRAATIHNAFNY